MWERTRHIHSVMKWAEIVCNECEGPQYFDRRSSNIYFDLNTPPHRKFYLQSSIWISFFSYLLPLEFFPHPVFRKINFSLSPRYFSLYFHLFCCYSSFCSFSYWSIYAIPWFLWVINEFFWFGMRPPLPPFGFYICHFFLL